MSKPIASYIFEEGGWEIYEEEDQYVLYTIPQYGGIPEVWGIYDSLDEAVQLAEETFK